MFSFQIVFFDFSEHQVYNQFIQMNNKWQLLSSG